MNEVVTGTETVGAEAQVARVRRRRVFYIPGYDPRGIAVYYRLYRSELRKYAERRGVAAKTGRVLQPDPELPWVHRWTSTVDAVGGTVETTVDFLGWDDLIEHEARFGWLAISWRSLRTFLISVGKGLYFRIGRLKRRSAILFAYPHVMSLLYNIAMGTMIIGGGALGLWLGRLAAGEIGARWDTLMRVGGALIGGGLGLFAATRFFRMVKRIDARTYVYHLILQVDFLRRNGLDQVEPVNRRREAMAAYIAAIMREAGEDEEIVVTGHSHGTYMAIGVVGRLLEIEPDLAGKRLVLFNLGTALPATTFYGPTERFRQALTRILLDRRIAFIESAATLDILGGSEGDYSISYKLDLPPGARRRPVLVKLDFRKVMSPEALKAIRWDFFRLHFQYLMASETGQGFDYFALMCGPRPLALLADDGDGRPT